eukprot:4060117-Pleurochrysis_carterae.AAC.2
MIKSLFIVVAEGRHAPTSTERPATAPPPAATAARWPVVKEVDRPVQGAAGWRAPSGSRATDTEVRFISVLLVAQAQDALLDERLDDVLLEEQTYMAAECWAAPTKGAWAPKVLLHDSLLADS